MFAWYKSKHFIIEKNYEDVSLIEKNSQTKIHLGDFYGDASCGLISRDEAWCLVGGDKLLIYNIPHRFKVDWIDEKLMHIEAIREINAQIFHILTDPWTEISAIWEINVVQQICTKIKNFTKYIGAEYTENIDW